MAAPWSHLAPPVGAEPGAKCLGAGVGVASLRSQRRGARWIRGMEGPGRAPGGSGDASSLAHDRGREGWLLPGAPTSSHGWMTCSSTQVSWAPPQRQPGPCPHRADTPGGERQPTERQGLVQWPPSWAAGSSLSCPKFPGGPDTPFVGKPPLGEPSTIQETDEVQPDLQPTPRGLQFGELMSRLTRRANLKGPETPDAVPSQTACWPACGRGGRSPVRRG